MTWREARSMPPPEAFAGRPHGTRLRYVSGCKCVPCRAANSSYETERFAARKRGEWNGLVDACRVRRHLRALSLKGIGYKQVADTADVGHTTLQLVMNGRKRRIRAAYERRVLAVDKRAIADGALVPAGPTWRRLHHLIEHEGFTRCEIAKRLGYRSLALQFKKTAVLARTEAKVERFYRLAVGL